MISVAFFICASVTSSFSSDDDNHHHDTPSRPRPSQNTGSPHISPNPPSQTTEHGREQGAYSEAHRQRNLGRFCTPNCLMGSIDGGELDLQCPNVKEDGKSCHQLIIDPERNRQNNAHSSLLLAA
jgi:hypothetical protein